MIQPSKDTASQNNAFIDLQNGKVLAIQPAKSLGEKENVAKFRVGGMNAGDSHSDFFRPVGGECERAIAERAGK